MRYSKAPRGDAKLINTPRGGRQLKKMSIVVLQAYYGGGSHVALCGVWMWLYI